MFVSQLSWDLWQGNQDHGDVVVVTDWAQVQGAIAALDGRSRTLVTLEADGETHMAIGGGGEAGYVAYVTFDNEVFEYLVDRDCGEKGRVAIVVGGQEGDYSRRYAVGLALVLEAARLFVEAGEVDRSVWEKDNVFELV
jgi:ABC-type sugar transport system substrate-binding protein